MGYIKINLARSNPVTQPKRKPAKFTATGKITVTALSLMGFIGGWNVIARFNHSTAQANEPAQLPAASRPTERPTATPWPTIAPLATLPPLPTLEIKPTALNQPGSSAPAAGPAVKIELAPIQLAPLPTLAPLPAVPAAPIPLTPLPAPPASSSSGSHRSGGS